VRRFRRAFSLLEVMFAVALFGAVVTFILAAQGGLIASNRRAADMSQAVEIARCRMSELEEKQLKLGFPEIEEKDTSTVCCDDKEVKGFECDWQVERIKLPESTSFGGDAGGSLLNLGMDAGALSSIATALPGALGGPASTALLNPAGGAGLSFDGGLDSFGASFQQQLAGVGGGAGLLGMFFSIVYPTLKPLLETAIRRITVVVRWKEGSIDRDFTLAQYVTNPSQAGLLAAMADAGAFGDGGAGFGATTAPGAGRTAVPGIH
jgi:general secretion pathway protein I